MKFHKANYPRYDATDSFPVALILGQPSPLSLTGNYLAKK